MFFQFCRICFSLYTFCIVQFLAFIYTRYNVESLYRFVNGQRDVIKKLLILKLTTIPQTHKLSLPVSGLSVFEMYQSNFRNRSRSYTILGENKFSLKPKRDVSLS